MQWALSQGTPHNGAGGIADKTIEVHRARVMEKMRAGSVAELVRVKAPLPE